MSVVGSIPRVGGTHHTLSFSKLGACCIFIDQVFPINQAESLHTANNVDLAQMFQPFWQPTAGMKIS